MKRLLRQALPLIILTLLTITVVTPINTCLGANVATDMTNALTNSSLPGGDENTALTMVGNVIGVFLSLLGIIFMILIIYGGFKWMTARGAEEEVTAAKTIIRNAVIGLIIVMAAYAISFFITSQLEKTIK